MQLLTLEKLHLNNLISKIYNAITYFRSSLIVIACLRKVATQSLTSEKNCNLMLPLYAVRLISLEIVMQFHLLEKALMCLPTLKKML